MAIDKELRLKIIQEKSGTAIADMKADIDVLEKSLLKIRIANVQLKKDYGAASQEFANGKKQELRVIAELTAQKKLLATTEKTYANEVKKVNEEIRSEARKSAQESKQSAKELTDIRKQEAQALKEQLKLQRELEASNKKRDSKLTGQSTELGSINALRQQIKYFTEQRNAVNSSSPAFATLDQKVKSLTQSLRDQTGAGKTNISTLAQLGANATIITAGLVTLARQVTQFGREVFDAAQQGAEFQVLYNHFVEVQGGADNAAKSLDLFSKAAAGNLNVDQLVRYSNGMTELGFSAETTAQLLDVAERQGDKVGVVFEVANEKLQKFILTGSGRGLGELKINIGTVHNEMERLTGKTLDQIGKLDELEQQTIRVNAITSLYGDTLDNIGQKTGDNADLITAMGKKYEDLVLLLKIGVSNAFSTVTKDIQLGTGALGENITKMEHYGKQVGNVLRLIKEALNFSKLLGDSGYRQNPDGSFSKTGSNVEGIKDAVGDYQNESSEFTREQIRQNTFASQKIQEKIDSVKKLNESNKKLEEEQEKRNREKLNSKTSKGGKSSTTKEKDPYEQENKEAKEFLTNINNELRLLELKKSKYKDLNEVLSELAKNESIFTKEGIEADNYISFLELQKKLIGDIASQKETELDKQEKITAEIRKQLEINKELPGIVAELNKELEESLKREKEIQTAPSLLKGKTPDLFDLSQEVQGIESQEKTNFEAYKLVYRQSQDTLSNVSQLLNIFEVKAHTGLYKIISGVEKFTSFFDTLINLLGSKTGSGLLNIFGSLLGFIPGVGPLASAAAGAVGSGGGIAGSLPSSFGSSKTGQIVNNISSTPSRQNMIVQNIPYILKVKASATDLYYALEKVDSIEKGRTG